MKILESEELDLIMQMLEEYVDGRIPAMPARPDDTYLPVGKALLARLRDHFGVM